MKQTPEAYVRRVAELKSLPQVYERVTAAINKPDSSADTIGDVVGEDPGLTARLLRIVNSAFFGFPSKVDTISRAVTLIGVEELRDLALATSVIQLFESLPSDFADMESYWRHCVAVGVGARVIASHRQESNVERYFVAGLLHDIGSLVVWMKGGKEARRISKRLDGSGEPLRMAERSVLGFDHMDVGRVLLTQWRLPPVLIESAATHHAPKRASRFPMEANVIHVADFLASAMELGGAGEPNVPPLSAGAWDALELPLDLLPTLVEEIDDQYREAVRVILGPLR